MPHVKGNKFKPAAPPAEPAGEAAAEPPPEQRPAKKPRTAKPAVQLDVATVVHAAPKGKASNVATATSNWAALQAALRARHPNSSQGGKRRRPGGEADTAPPAKGAVHVDPSAQPTRVLALDCEMVGAGSDGKRSLLARVCLVNAAGLVLYDSFVRPTERVTDYRTRWSGVRAGDVRAAPLFEAVQAVVAPLLQGRVVVGHAVDNDLQALGLTHPPRDVRDTARYPPFMKTLTNGRSKQRALRVLAQEYLGMSIQEAEHSPAEDARTALALYQKHKAQWEGWLAGGGSRAAAPTSTGAPLLVAATSRSKVRPHASRKQRLAEEKPEAATYAAHSLAELAKRDYMADL